LALGSTHLNAKALLEAAVDARHLRVLHERRETRARHELLGQDAHARPQDTLVFLEAVDDEAIDLQEALACISSSG